MEIPDHKRTASWGYGRTAQEYQRTQKALWESGRYEEAMRMDIRDVRSKFGNKYDRQISEMLDYAKKEGFLPPTFEP
jgi:filamentous hemagglutinin